LIYVMFPELLSLDTSIHMLGMRNMSCLCVLKSKNIESSWLLMLLLFTSFFCHFSTNPKHVLLHVVLLTLLGNLPNQASRSSDRYWWRKTWKSKSCHYFYSWRSPTDYWHESGSLSIPFFHSFINYIIQ